MPNFSYKVNSEVLKIELAEDSKTATGVTFSTKPRKKRCSSQPIW